ncbi:MAG: hypothetical protein A3F94_02695 [Candidatus Spechtbacteria bacterium RIFCSPLOWO2_12_FULL_38_22]|uniref:Uncharacterized protein n=1 Tax=Candidatus Spechtbacteria bacterium RIFCSPLOWO2_12_FULL_38_22 TaxID=1802165 RepID=A0A1G2HID7_9BACT|nr:MAG: hypothetical protein A3E58_01965 [Candidatus Spechtbacteria bacterium RIFCSPHIGHO2_12_FULL_38_30]OGZ62213.1 MAG: hypothetical protein A3F94_02695 [Candidatus Spechtbacteria bacterium RIFCSPLOWO2_12_FULL_38_22]
MSWRLFTAIKFMKKIKVLPHLNKQLILSIVLGVVILGAGSFFYFGNGFDKGVSPKPKNETDIIKPNNLEILCEGFSSLPLLEQEDYTKRLDEIYARDELTRKELNELLPYDCVATEL